MISLGISDIWTTAAEAERPQLQRLGAPAPDDDYWYTPRTRGGITGLSVSEAGSLSNDAVWACVGVIASTVASLPFGVYERITGGKQPAPDHPVHDIIHNSPNAELTAPEFWEMALGQTLLWGNSYAEIRWNSKLYPESLTMLDPDRVYPERDKETGVRYYRYRPAGTAETRIIFADDMLHLPCLMMPDGLRGYSPITVHRRSIEMGMSFSEYILRYFANNARPGMYISHPNKLSEEAVKRLRESWASVHGGLQNAGKPGILEEGMKLELVGSPAKDMEFLAQQKYTDEKVARLYRVPPHKIGILDKATFSNIEHQGIEFVVSTILPWCRKIEARVAKTLFGSRERARFFPEFNLNGLQRGDSVARAQYYATMRNSGLMTANEIRALENMNPVEGGDELLVQGAMIPASQAGQQQNQAVKK